MPKEQEKEKRKKPPAAHSYKPPLWERTPAIVPILANDGGAGITPTPKCTFRSVWNTPPPSVPKSHPRAKNLLTYPFLHRPLPESSLKSYCSSFESNSFYPEWIITFLEI